MARMNDYTWDHYECDHGGCNDYPAIPKSTDALSPERRSRSRTTCTLCASPPHATQHFCTSCYDAKYCGNECLETDEDVHSLVCPTFDRIPRKLLPDEPQGMKMVRAVVFEVDRNAPRFMWVSVQGNNPIGLYDYLGNLPVEIKFPSLCLEWRKNTVRDRKLPYMVRVYINGKVDENENIRRVIEMSRWWLEAEAKNKNSTRVQDTTEENHESLSQQFNNCYCIRPNGPCPETADFKGVQMQVSFVSHRDGY
jgi:hypothetical protein